MIPAFVRTALFFVGIVALIFLHGCVSSSPPKNSSTGDKRKIAELNTQIAIEHMRERDYELALTKLAKATEADPNYDGAYNILGVIYSRIDETDKAEQSFKRALRIEPNSSSTLNNYGQYLCRQKDYEKGQQMLLRATENPLYRTPEIALSNAGTCALDAGQIDIAEQHFRNALQANSRIPGALLNMAQISFDSNKYLPARGYLQRYSEVARHTAQSLWLGIQVERELGDKDAVASYTLQLEKTFPDSKEASLLENSG